MLDFHLDSLRFQRRRPRYLLGFWGIQQQTVIFCLVWWSWFSFRWGPSRWVRTIGSLLRWLHCFGVRPRKSWQWHLPIVMEYRPQSKRHRLWLRQWSFRRWARDCIRKIGKLFLLWSSRYRSKRRAGIQAFLTLPCPSLGLGYLSIFYFLHKFLSLSLCILFPLGLLDWAFELRV